MEVPILFLWLYSVMFSVHCQIDSDHQNFDRRMTLLEVLVQSMVTEFGGLLQKNSDLEYKYHILYGELQRLRIEHDMMACPDDGDTVEPNGPITGEVTKRNIASMVGPKGEKGVPGPKGDAGIPGFNGDDGLDGVDGQKGEKGDHGAEGPKGSDGGSGFNGDDGHDGLDGAKGEVGPAGPKGGIGQKGAKGELGLTGDVGTPGPKGDSGMRGINGPKGGPGAPGPKGQKGITGSIGWTGAAGKKGDKGATGYPGFQGNSGIKGSKGDKGNIGYRGQKGETGFTGQKGEPGQSMSGTKRKIAFSAELDSHFTTLRAGTVVVFQHQTLNAGNYYSPFQGIFQCGVSGFYIFTWTMAVNSGHGLTTLLDVNGSPRGYLYSVGQPYNWNSGSNSVMVDLNVGDRVSVKIVYSTDIGAYPLSGSSFFGFLLD